MGRASERLRRKPLSIQVSERLDIAVSELITISDVADVVALPAKELLPLIKNLQILLTFAEFAEELDAEAEQVDD